MTVSATRTLPASRETIWDVLAEPGRVASLVPGVENVERHGRTWLAQARIPLGIGDLEMALSFDVVEERRPDLVRIATQGTGVGMVLAMESEIRLEAVDGDATAVRWESEVSVTGPSGAMGRRVLPPIAEQQAAKMLEALEQTVVHATASRG